MSQIVNAAIAVSDALTATHAGKVNQKNHAAAVETLRDALGNRLPDAQETNLRRILDEKDAVAVFRRYRLPGRPPTVSSKIPNFPATLKISPVQTTSPTPDAISAGGTVSVLSELTINMISAKVENCISNSTNTGTCTEPFCS